MPNKLEQLKKVTVVVADTGDIEAIQRYQPLDATTNPSLLLKAAQLPQYAHLVKSAVQKSKNLFDSTDGQLNHCMDLLAVNIGKEILSIIPGRVSTEVDARLSFDTQATVQKARQIISLYNEAGIANDRVLIKIAATWEGIRAAEILESEGINCNLTLLFSFSQAAAAADAGAFLISPFVGRILDWHKANSSPGIFAPHEDPGVISVTNIYRFYKQQKYETIVMGASFRNTDEIEQLAGCDRLTISPPLLEALQNDNGELLTKLCSNNTGDPIDHIRENEQQFRWSLNSDAMATEKLAEGIRNFTKDQIALEQIIKAIAK